MNLTFERLYVYANQKYHEDTANTKYQQMSVEMQIMATALSQASSWLEQEILALPGETLEGFFTESANGEQRPNPAQAISKPGNRYCVSKILSG